MNRRLIVTALAAVSTACAVVADLGVDYGGASGDTGQDSGVPDGPAGGMPAASCKDLLARDPSTRGKNGVYPIDVDGDGGRAPLQLFCEMSLDDGGWTLVGRSAPGGGPPFGWTTSVGTTTDLSRPFSLDVAGLGLDFAEVLVADRAPTSLDAGARAYKFPFAGVYLTSHKNDSFKTAPVTTLFGDCRTPDGPEMLRYAGGSSLTDDFFMRDVNGIDQHRGLNAGSFNLTYQDCNRGGSLDGVQGLLFIR